MGGGQVNHASCLAVFLTSTIAARALLPVGARILIIRARLAYRSFALRAWLAFCTLRAFGTRCALYGLCPLGSLRSFRALRTLCWPCLLLPCRTRILLTCPWLRCCLLAPGIRVGALIVPLSNSGARFTVRSVRTRILLTRAGLLHSLLAAWPAWPCILVAHTRLRGCPLTSRTRVRGLRIAPGIAGAGFTARSLVHALCVAPTIAGVCIATWPTWPDSLVAHTRLRGCPLTSRTRVRGLRIATPIAGTGFTARTLVHALCVAPAIAGVCIAAWPTWPDSLIAHTRLLPDLFGSRAVSTVFRAAPVAPRQACAPWQVCQALAGRGVGIAAM